MRIDLQFCTSGKGATCGEQSEGLWSQLGRQEETGKIRRLQRSVAASERATFCVVGDNPANRMPAEETPRQGP